jgi:hypothetical protein
LFQEPARHARGGAEGGGGLEETTTINLKRLGIHDGDFGLVSDDNWSGGQTI